MHSSINGNEITGVTINGKTVKEITANGKVVWRLSSPSYFSDNFTSKYDTDYTVNTDEWNYPTTVDYRSSYDRWDMDGGNNRQTSFVWNWNPNGNPVHIQVKARITGDYHKDNNTQIKVSSLSPTESVRNTPQYELKAAIKGSNYSGNDVEKWVNGTRVLEYTSDSNHWDSDGVLHTVDCYLSSDRIETYLDGNVVITSNLGDTTYIMDKMNSLSVVFKQADGEFHEITVDEWNK